MKEYLLFTPGPVNIELNVRMATLKSDICHRESDFDFLLQGVEDKLLTLLDIKNKSNYRAVVITGSGTAANESILSSVVGERNILIVSNGEFGERLFHISEVHNKNTSLLRFPWGKKLDIKKIEEYVSSHKVDIVCMVHHETSSGMMNSLECVGAIAKAHGAMFIADCVSSAGAEVIDMEKCNIAFCSSSSSKAISSYPGLSFVVGKKDEFEKIKNLPIKTTYLNLYKFYTFIKEASQTPNTPAVHLFYALDQALMNILNEGVSSHHALIKKRASALRKGMLKLGLTFLIDRKDMSSVLTTVNIPSHIDLHDFHQKLYDKSIIVYKGKGCFEDRVFQVGNIGELSFGDIRFFLDALKSVLQSFDCVKEENVVSTGSISPLLAHTKKFKTSIGECV
ncbi:MAG: aminotransferase class V-fold PLP-dependent enzyme [Oleibacter sp.]|nr:aminotransferase class V-fold PLP-dependent enzyme [Thalassolituus sp.]